MKDYMKTCPHVVSEGAIYKEVVVIGNGPSGMVTSFMLAGNVPYLKEHIPEDLPIDDMLRARLNNLEKGRCLYDTDLMQLAEGMEGRSQNPIPLLMDTLLRPCTDLGLETDSLIEWRFEADKQIEHVVLGRGPPGGAWHTFPPAVRTLSPGGWLALPPHGSAGAGRLTARAVALYCRRYVKQMRLQRYFRCGVLVTSVTPVTTETCTCPLRPRWLVTGVSVGSGRPFRYVCARVVVCAGGADRPNALHVRLPRAAHSLAQLHEPLHALHAAHPEGRVLVVGSGVSAADAVREARALTLRVAHVHRDPAPALAVPSAIYPDYHQVYKMMCDGTTVKYENYIPYPEHVIVKVNLLPQDKEISHLQLDPDIEETIRPKKVKLLNMVTNEIEEITVNLIAVLIGSKPDLFFLQPNFDLNCIDIKSKIICSHCTETKHAAKRKIEADKPCFFKNHWHYLKSILNQGVQSCKSRYLSAEINGNTDTKCIIPEYNQKIESKCTCNSVIVDENQCQCHIIPYHSPVKAKIKCTCQEENPYSNGLGLGLDPNKPIDCRANPIAIDKSTHELLNAPKGIYALGPLTGDNFIRFIPGGALAVVAHIHQEKKI